MKQIGVRELKANASAILRQLASGGEGVVVTSHGKPVAVLGPAAGGALGTALSAPLPGAAAVTPGPRPAPHGCIVLGVSGSIAAYKAAEITSSLTKAGVEVHVIMTASATKLVQPQTFFTLSRNAVVTDLWSVPEWEPEHIALAERAQLLVIAPATANILAKMAHGIADDALSSYVVSHTGAILVAPAMNPRMWAQPVVQENCRILRERGVRFVGPDCGSVACGGGGVGRFAAPAAIVRAILVALQAATLAQRTPRRVLVTAGPTREALDPVRYLSNRSSGKMGYALAEVAAAAGHAVTLISGPTALAAPAGCTVVHVESAADMATAVKAAFPDTDLLIMSAAVADYRPAVAAPQKLKKSAASRTLALEPTEDILSSLGPRRRAGQRVVGFAAETQDLAAAAQAKLRRKHLDWIVANDVSRRDIGFDQDENEVTVYGAQGAPRHLPKQSKLALAAALLAIFLADSRA